MPATAIHTLSASPGLQLLSKSRARGVLAVVDACAETGRAGVRHRGAAHCRRRSASRDRPRRRLPDLARAMER